MILGNPIYPGVDIKADALIPGNFSGSPKKAVVSFIAPFDSVNYTVGFSVFTDGIKTFSPSFENQTVNGFDVNLNTNNVSGLITVGWIATAI